MQFSYRKYIYKKISLYIILVILTILLGSFIKMLPKATSNRLYKNYTYKKNYNYPIFKIANYDDVSGNYIANNYQNSDSIDYDINVINEYVNILFIKSTNNYKTYDSYLFDPNKKLISLIDYLNIDEYTYYYHINDALEARNIVLDNDISKVKISYSINNNSIDLFIDDKYEITILTELFKEKVVPVQDTKNYKYVAFTFDDGPSKYTLEIMDILDKYNFKATFFEVGYMMKSNPEIVKEVINRGYEIGNHTTDHSNLNKLSENEIISKIENNSNILKEYTGNTMKLVRCPYGNSNSKVKSLINYPIIYWSIDSRDWESRNAEKIFNIVSKDIQDGDIVLFHDLYETTKEAVNNLVPYLSDNGYKIVSVSELFKIKEKQLENHKVYRNAR